MAMLPTEVPPDRREMVLMAGRGSYMMATRMTDAAGKAFEGLVARYPETPNIHYAYGVFLLIEQPAKAIEEFKRELEIQPNDPESLMQIAYQNLKDSDPASALPWAKQAVDAAPNVFASHRALGEALSAPETSKAGSLSWRSRSARRPTARGHTSRSRRHTSAQAAQTMRQRNGQSSSGSIASRERTAAGHNRWAGSTWSGWSLARLARGQ